VFIPVSFLGGLAGELYRQFAVTISVSVVISGIVALTLTPALGAIFLQQHREPAAPFRAFNRGFEWITRRFVSVVGYFLRHTFQSLVFVLIMLGVTAYLFVRVPSSLLPDEDQGYNFLVMLLPLTASGRIRQ
jgi:multidrug efflux pump subunit AcrB